MDKKKYFVQQRKAPAVCRSKRFRMAGISPAEAANMERASSAYVPSDNAPAHLVWDYSPGNSPMTAILIERGIWDNCIVSEPFYFRSYNPETTNYERHTAWRNATRWYCVDDETKEIPGFTGRGWMAADRFEQLTVSIDANRIADDRWHLITHVIGCGSGDEISPVASIPAVMGWRKETIRGNLEQLMHDQEFNERMRGASPSTVFTKDDLGNGYGVTLTFYMEMNVGMETRSQLEDLYGNLLTDVTGDPLWVSESVGEETIKEISGNVTINFT